MKAVLVVLCVAFSAFSEAYCPFLCQCDDTKRKVVCSPKANLDIIPITLNPAIKEIHLRGNQIRTVDASFQFYGQLEFVDFSNNQMSELPNKCFAKQSKLQHLQMDFNLIGNITNATFSGLKSLTYLSLRGNQLTSLNSQLAILEHLRELDLGQNLIEFISEAAFVSLGKLEVLHLDGNQLASVPSADTLRPLASTLLSLNLGQNAIQKLESEVFLPLKNLKSLNLTGASIVNISYDAFRGLSGNTGQHSGLQILSLASNALDRFPNLGLLHRLQRLEIGGNFIEKIQALDLTGLSSLQVLDLSDSPNLVSIGAGLLAETPSMTVISVSGCHQLSIEAKAFTFPSQTDGTLMDGKIPEGRQLRLRLSDLGWSSLPPQIADWSQVAAIDLTSNPLECDCKLAFLRDLLSDTLNDTDEQSYVFCQHPQSLQGQPLQDIPRSYLRCNSILDVAKRPPEDQLILVTICVSAALTLGLVTFVAVHCRRQLKACVKDKHYANSSLLWSLHQDPRNRNNGHLRSSWCCDNDVIADIATTSSEMASTPEDLCCSCVVHHPNRGGGLSKKAELSSSQQLGFGSTRDFEFLHADFNTLNTKSSFLGGEDDQDYFLSLSKDRRFLTPIPVSEL